MYLCTVFGLYSALRNLRSPLRNVHSPLRNVDTALRNITRIPVLWKCKQVMRKNYNSILCDNDYRYHKHITISIIIKYNKEYGKVFTTGNE